VAGFPHEFSACTGFQWDAGNATKNWEPHKVAQAEAEQLFFNRPIRVAVDATHSREEARYGALGQTSAGRLLSVVFTIRGTLVRVISARDMSGRERRVYERAQEAE
jgi:hypothetical protein